METATPEPIQVAKELIKCPWCPCMFCSRADFERHVKAFRITGYAPNEYDHKVAWEKLLRERDREYIENG